MHADTTTVSCPSARHTNSYVVRCSFTTETRRVFDVLVERTKMMDIDLVHIGGGLANTAIQQVVPASVRDGFLTIKFLNGLDNPLISAIEVSRIGEAPPTLPPVNVPPTPAPVGMAFQTILINCGGLSYTDTQGRQWSRDQYFQGGSTYANTAVDIKDTEDDRIYWSERYGTFTYNIPVPLGNYEVVLHFAEIKYVPFYIIRDSLESRTCVY
jgi:Malectin domain